MAQREAVMVQSAPPGFALVRIRLGADSGTPLLLVSRTLDDLNNLYELIALVVDSKYANVSFPSRWRVRRDSRLEESDRATVRRVHLSSPFWVDLALAFGALG